MGCFSGERGERGRAGEVMALKIRMRDIACVKGFEMDSIIGVGQGEGNCFAFLCGGGRRAEERES